MSFAVGIASIIIAVITLRQNSKMIAESTRPYIVVQFERAYTSTLRCYFVVKIMAKRVLKLQILNVLQKSLQSLQTEKSMIK